MDAENLMSAQDDVFNRAIQILTSSDHVLGVIAIGSYARDEQDVFSDIDLVCCLRDDERNGWRDLYDQIRVMNPILWYGWLYDENALFLFENGARLDVDFLVPSDIDRINQIPTAKKILFDPDGVMQEKWCVKNRPNQRIILPGLRLAILHSFIGSSGCFGRRSVGRNAASRAA